MLNLLLTFVPDSALPLIVVGAGLLIILGVVKPPTAFGFISMLVLTIVAAPFVEELFAQLPFMWTLLVMLGMGFWALRTVLEFVLGKHAAGHVIGTAFVGTTLVVFKLMLFTFRLFGCAIRARCWSVPQRFRR